MDMDEDLMRKLLGADLSGLEFEMRLGDESFALDSVDVIKVAAPVTGRTERGGAYFSDTEQFKLRARLSDRRITRLIPDMMLGPSAEFADVRILAGSLPGGGPGVCFHTNLTNSMENASRIELYLAVTGTETLV